PSRPGSGASGPRGLFPVLARVPAVARPPPLRRGCRAGTVAGNARPRLPLSALLEARGRSDRRRESRGAPGAVVDRLLGPSHAGAAAVARTTVARNFADPPLPQRRRPRGRRSPWISRARSVSGGGRVRRPLRRGPCAPRADRAG